MPLDPELRTRLDLARAELKATAAAARTALRAARTQLAPTREELAQLQADARSGDLGPEMKRLAGLVADGLTTWPSVFDGSSPYAELLAPHLARMDEEHTEAVRVAIQNDDTFDPEATSPGV